MAGATVSNLLINCTDLTSAGTITITDAVSNSGGDLDGEFNLQYFGPISEFAGVTGTAQVTTTGAYSAPKGVKLMSLVTELLQP